MSFPARHVGMNDNPLLRWPSGNPRRRHDLVKTIALGDKVDITLDVQAVLEA